LAQLIELRTCGVEKCSIKFDKGKYGTDCASIYVSVEKKPYYFDYTHYGYFDKRNTLDYHLKIRRYDCFELKGLGSPAITESWNNFMKSVQDAKVLKNGYLGYRFNFAKMSGQHYFIQNY
jgi:hypothetical protein